ncbi:hypothetical protein [Nocardia sp. CA-120079]|uniref:hypothetical protein n=1 Tax=Nocardia sp. CA-120079 TaxID=3239974 RepID=UPI003D972D5F
MKASVWHGVGGIRLGEVAHPKIEERTDALVKITTSATCGTDRHSVRGSSRSSPWWRPDGDQHRQVDRRFAVRGKE